MKCVSESWVPGGWVGSMPVAAMTISDAPREAAVAELKVDLQDASRAGDRLLDGAEFGGLMAEFCRCGEELDRLLGEGAAAGGDVKSHTP